MRIWRVGVVRMILVALAIPLAAERAAEAQEPSTPSPLPSMTLEDLMRVQVEPVFGASKREQPVTEAPASVTIVTADDIARHGYRTLAEILSTVRGFYTTYDRNYTYLGARGFSIPGDYNTRILILVDGHRMNDDIYEQATPGEEFGLDPSTFSRVEIIRGPASSLYGTSAFFAVVNIITKSGADISGASGNVETGSFGLRSARLAVGRKLGNGVDYLLSGSFLHTDGPGSLYFPEFNAPETDAGIVHGLDDEDARQMFGGVSVGHFTVRGAYGHREKGVPTAAFDTVFGDPRFRTTDAHGYVDAQYDQSIGATRLNVRTYVDRYHYDGTYPQEGDTDASPVILYNDYANGVWAGGEARATRPIGSRHVLIYGAELRDNVRADQGITYADDTLPSFLIKDPSREVAAYSQDEFKLSERLLINAGLRFDAYSGHGRFAPRVAVIFKTSSSQAIKYLYGNAFRAPNAYETDYSIFGDRRASLLPETIDTHEIVWERYTGRSVRTSVSAYMNDVRRLLTAVPSESADLLYVNSGHVRAAGLELETEVRLRSGLQAVASYVVQRTKDADTGDELVNSPRHQGKVQLSVMGPARLTTAFDMQLMSARRTLLDEEVGAVALGNVTWRLPLRRGLLISSRVLNLFNQTYADPGSEEHREDSIQQDGRTFRIALEWTLKGK